MDTPPVHSNSKFNAFRGYRGVEVDRGGYRGVQMDNGGYRGVQVGRDGCRGVAIGVCKWVGRSSVSFFYLPKRVRIVCSKRENRRRSSSHLQKLVAFKMRFITAE